MFDLMQYALIFYDVQLILARMTGPPVVPAPQHPACGCPCCQRGASRWATPCAGVKSFFSCKS